MKGMIYWIVSFTGALLIFSGCSQKVTGIEGYYPHKTECMESELDGSITVMAYGNGRDERDAGEQARKNAVNDVLFNGITNGKADCWQRPLLSNKNVREQHAAYFNRFFTDGGEFKRYVSLKDERSRDDRELKGARKSMTLGVVLRVERAKLKDKLIKDGILK